MVGSEGFESDDFESKKRRTHKKRKKSDCMARYRVGKRFRAMSIPGEDSSKKSRFGGCVRAQMKCRNLSEERAKKICGYIKHYVQK